MMTPATDIPNIDTTRDRCFTLDTGETVAVRVERPPNQLTNADIAVHVTARLIDPATGATLQEGGRDVVAPTYTATVPVGSFDVPGFDLLAFVAGVVTDQAPRARAYRASLQALALFAPAAP